MGKIVCLKKYDPSVFFWDNLVRKKQIKDLSLEELILQHKGYEGEILFSNTVETALDLLVTSPIANRKQNTITLFLDRGEFNDEELTQHGYDFSGYEYGTCDEERTVYSSIFNEILFGHHPELVSFLPSLNQHFLFPDVNTASSYRDKHQELYEKGEDVEAEDDLTLSRVWVKSNGY